MFFGTLRAYDASNGANDPTETLFRNFVAEGNDFYGLPGDGNILFYCAETMAVRDNRVWGCSGRWFAPDSGLDDIFAGSVYRNEVYRSSVESGTIISCGGTWTVAQQITDNVIEDARTTARLISLDFSDHASASSVIDYNQWYAPNDSNGQPFYDGAEDESFATWQSAGFDANGSVADPGWTAPANGVFDAPAAGYVRFTTR